MSEFLVRIEFVVPDLSDVDVADLTAAEQARSVQLQLEGTLVRIWRDPTRQGSWGWWKAESAASLEDVLASLPFWPWMDATIYPLERHRFALPSAGDCTCCDLGALAAFGSDAESVQGGEVDLDA
ncbi:muconolactone Delta-isomerase family protein [Nocardioides sp.]|uniref:muconolactone Delta-isomerase family protein n=1 Tax=Nocardioides sp. TaxID=35761 RepID=UPI0026304F4E|nr:muconolactone Delta-isomerase family protein [Nocardioides sp.]MDI6911726.1 muconolactone Delta-isomerase family protein [Nocardioides sp.]